MQKWLSVGIRNHIGDHIAIPIYSQEEGSYSTKNQRRTNKWSVLRAVKIVDSKQDKW